MTEHSHTMAQGLIETMVSVGTKAFNESGQHPTTFLIVHRNQQDETELIVAQTPWSSPYERSMYLSAVKSLIHQVRAVSYGVVSEVWMKSMDQAEADSHRAAGIRLADLESKEEAIIFAAVDSSGEQIVRAFGIDRDETSVKVGAEMSMEGLSGLGGDLLELMQ